MVGPRQVSLVPYSTPCGFVDRLDVAVARPQADALALRYTLVAKRDRVRIPPPATCARADGLWRHTCFEAFLKLAGESAYRELNFSPSGEWAAYRFSGYRTGMLSDPEQSAPQLEVHPSADGLILDARVPLPPALATATALTMAIAAVVESDDGTLSYWALRHPGSQPDFHHSDSFLLELAR